MTGTYTRLDDPVQLNTLDLNPLPAVRETPVGEDFIDRRHDPDRDRNYFTIV